MIEGLKPYPEYKDINIPSFGPVPKDWKTLRAKYCYREVDERSKTGREVLCSVSHKTGVTPRKSNVTMFMAESTVGYKICRPSDLVINTLWAWMAALGIARQVGIVSPAYGVYRPLMNSALCPSYADRLLRTPQYMREYMARSTGVNASRLRLYPEQFLSIPLLLPPPDEQAAIIKFLDYANGKIERAIRAKRKLIGLLNEQKQAIIHRAVTRGLDPNVKLKPSGVPWLGDVPKHWEVRKLGTVADLIVSNVDKHSHTNEKRVRLCNYVDVYKNDTIHERLNFMQATATSEEIKRFRIRVGDVIITKDSEGWDDIGVPSLVCYQSDDLVCGYHLAILRHLPRLITGEFLHQVITNRFVATQMHVRAKGVTRYGLSHSAIRQVLLPLPPLSEQIPICQQLTRELNTLVITISRLEREIDLLREYRTTLTAEVVTGKLDVREAAKRLPDQTDEPLPVDESLEDLVDDEITEEDEA
jgi:type I restriction enzyme S subunit